MQATPLRARQLRLPPSRRARSVLEALLELAETSLSASDAERIERTRVVVHVDAAALSSDGSGRAELQDGPVISPETARRLGCDADVMAQVERDGLPMSAGRRRRTVPVNRSSLARDKGDMRAGTVTTATDADVLGAVAEGDADALRVLFDRHAPWLTLRLGRRCADRDVVDDAVQDTFVEVWRHASRYEGRGEVAAWIWGIAVRRLIDGLRRRPRLAIVPRAEVEQVAQEEQILLGVEYGDLGGALNRLSPELRAVVQATVLDGLTTREAGRLLGIPAGTVKTRMMRARAQLREALA